MPEIHIAAPAPQPKESDEPPCDAATATHETQIPETNIPDEYDRRGIKLPARTRVGGIITPI